MEIITITKSNLDREQLDCTWGDSTKDFLAYHKKQWLKTTLSDGLIYQRIKGCYPAFIEYMPIEMSWSPIIASNMLVIHCFWVGNPYKHLGYGEALLNSCIEYAKDHHKDGIVITSSSRKKPFLSDGDYLIKHGFQVADTALGNVELLYYPLSKTAPAPKYTETAKLGTIEEQGIVIYYSHQCVFTEKYIDLLHYAFKREKILLSFHRYKSKEEAKKAHCPFTTYSVFINGKFYTHEILREKEVQQLALQYHL